MSSLWNHRNNPLNSLRDLNNSAVIFFFQKFSDGLMLDNVFVKLNVHVSPTRLLNLSLNSEVVLDQDAIDVIIHVARNPHGRDLAWKFFREKWKILNARYR